MAKMNDATPWLLPITISASGTRSNTFLTSGTWVDRDIQVSITTPAGSYDAYGGQLSITSTNLGITPTVTLSDANNKNISNYTVGARNTTYGYYVLINGSSSTGSKVITATRAAVTKSAAAGWINQNSGTQAIASANATATVSVNAGSGSTYVNIKAAGGGTLSGGGSWNLSHTLNYTDSTVDSATISLTDLTSGYRKIILNGDSLSKTVTRAAITAGYQPATNAATLTVTISCPADNIYIKEGTNTLAGGSLSKGDPSGGTLSLGTPTGGGLSSATVSGGGLDNSSISTLTIQRANNDSSSVGGKNIYSELSNSLTSEPTSGYFIAVTANASGSAVRADLSSVVTRAAYSRAVNLAAFSQTVTRAVVTDTQTAGYMDEGTQSLSSADTTVTLAASSKTVSLDLAQITVSYAGATKSLSKSSTVYIPITAATLANAGTQGTTYTDISSTGPILISNDYLYINAGYIPATKISLARLVPDLEGLVPGGAAHMRAGYSLYDKDGKVITGTMQDSTCTVAGGALSITANSSIGPGTLSLTNGNDSNISSTTVTIGAKDEANYPYYFKVHGATAGNSKTITATRAAVTAAHTEGYQAQQAATTKITSDSKNSKVTVTAGTGDTYVNLKKATISTTITDENPSCVLADPFFPDVTVDSSITPSSGLSNINKSSSRPSSGYYIQLDSEPKNMVDGTYDVMLPSMITLVTSGYHPGGEDSEATVPDMCDIDIHQGGRSRTEYITIPTGSCTVTGGGLTKGNATGGGLTTETASGGTLSGGGLTKGAGSVSYAKFTTDGSNAGVNITTNGTNAYTETEPASGYYVSITITGSGTVNRAAVNLSKFSLKVNRAAFSLTVTRAAVTDTHTAGYIPAKNATTVIAADSSTVTLAADDITVELASATIAAGSLASNTATKNVYIPLKTATYSVSCSKTNPSVAYTNSTNMKSASTGTYYFTYGGTITSGTHKATATISAAGYVPTGNKSTTAEAIGVTESGNGTVYIPTSSVSAAGSVTTLPLVVAATNPVNLVTSMTATAYNVGLATTTNNAGTVAVKHTASEGYTGTLTNVADSNVSVETIVTLGGSLYVNGVTILSGDTGNFTVNDGTYTWTWKKDANGNVWVV